MARRKKTPLDVNSSQELQSQEELSPVLPVEEEPDLDNGQEQTASPTEWTVGGGDDEEYSSSPYLETEGMESIETLEDEEAGEEDSRDGYTPPPASPIRRYLEEPDSGEEEEVDGGVIPASPPRPVRRPSQAKTGNQIRHLPPSKIHHYSDQHKTWAGKPQRFFDYWRKLEELPWAKGRMLCYVYRIYPVMKDDGRQVDKVADWFPYEDLARRYGAGDYHLKLNDAGMNYKPLAICTVKNAGERNWNEYPPVLDPDLLEMDDPLNKPYISWARSRGIAFPGDALWEANQRAKREQEDKMAETKIVSEAWDFMKQQVESSKKGDRDRDEVPADALTKSIELISKAGEVQSKILEKGIDRVMDLQKREGAGSLGSLKETIELVRSLSPRSDTSIEGIVNTIMNMESKHADKLFQIQMQMREAQEKEITYLKEQMTRLLERAASPQPASAVSTEKPKSLRDQLAELKESRDLIREALGIEGAEKEGGWVEHLPLIVQAGSVLIGSMASIIHNLAVIQGKGGTAMQPPPVSAALSPEQNEALGQMGMGQPPVQAQPSPQQRVNQPPQENENAMTRAHQFFGLITTPLLRSFNAGESGADFAARLIELTDSGYFGADAQGAQVYDQILEMGQPLIYSLLKTYPPIWSVVSQTPAKWERFLGEFFRAREIWAEEEREESGAAEEIIPPPSGPAA